MLDLIFSAARAQLQTWTDETARRRQISKLDPVADTLEHCAEEMTELLDSLEKGSEWLTPEEYALAVKPRPVSAQTVRNWIHRGELKASDSARGFVIHRSARRVRRLKSA